MRQLSEKRKKVILENEELFKKLHETYIEDLTTSLDSLKSEVGGMTFGKREIYMVFDLLELRRRTPEETKQSRILASQAGTESFQNNYKQEETKKIDAFSEFDIIKAYANGAGVRNLAESIGVSREVLASYLEEKGQVRRGTYSHKNLLEDIEASNNISMEDIRKWYIIDNLTASVTRRKISIALNKSEDFVTEKLFRSFTSTQNLNKK